MKKKKNDRIAFCHELDKVAKSESPARTQTLKPLNFAFRWSMSYAARCTLHAARCTLHAARCTLSQACEKQNNISLFSTIKSKIRNTSSYNLKFLITIKKWDNSKWETFIVFSLAARCTLSQVCEKQNNISLFSTIKPKIRNTSSYNLKCLITIKKWNNSKWETFIVFSQ